jgi:hypothetical protein
MFCPPLRGHKRSICLRLKLTFAFLGFTVLFGRSQFYDEFCKHKGLRAFFEGPIKELCARVFFLVPWTSGCLFRRGDHYECFAFEKSEFLAWRDSDCDCCGFDIQLIDNRWEHLGLG